MIWKHSVTLNPKLTVKRRENGAAWKNCDGIETRVTSWNEEKLRFCIFMMYCDKIQILSDLIGVEDEENLGSIFQ